MNYQRNWRIARNRNAKMLLLLTCLLISQVNSITTLEDSIFYNHLTSNNIDENISLEGVKYKNVPKLRSYLSEKAYRSFINSDEHDEQDTISDLTVPETLPNNNRAGMFKITGGESVTNNILPINGDFEADSPGIYFQNQGGFMTGWDHLNNFRNIGPVEGRIVSGQSFVIVDQDGANYGSPAGEIQTHDMYNFTIEETETYMISSHLRVNCASGSTDRDLYAEVNFNFYNSTSDILGGVSFRIHRNWPGINGSNSFSFDLAKSEGVGTDTGWHFKEINLITDCFNNMVDFDEPAERAEIAKCRVFVKSGNSLGSSWYSEAYFDNIQINYTSTGNTLPVAENLILSPSTPLTTDDLVASYDYFDADGDSEVASTTKWFKDSTEQMIYENQTFIPSTATSKGETWYFMIQVYDGTNKSDWVTSSSVIIGNSIPQASNVKINETSPVAEDSDLHVLYTYSDSDSDSQDNTSRQIRWFKNGLLRVDMNDTMIIGSGNTSAGDFWYFTLRVSDGFNLSTLVTSPSVSIAAPVNQLPIASNLNFTILNPLTTDYLYINWTYSDADLDPESGSMYYWYQNGVYISLYDGLQNLSASATTKGEEWHVKVKPRDDIDFGVLVGVPVNVTIGNTAPSVSNLVISPSNPITGSDFSASYIFSDIDSDVESGSLIIWYKNNVLQGVLNDSLTVDSSFTTKSEEWHFKVRPSDGTDFGYWESCPINVTIDNTPPTISNLEINPSNPNTTDDLFASYTFSDVDISDFESGSLVSWFKNGLLQSSLNDLLTVTSSLTADGENWFFSLRPSDGTDYGILVNSTTVIIGPIVNTPPIVENLTLSPSTPLTADDLLASYDYFDSNGDLETGSELLWFKDGILQGILNGTTSVQAGNTSKSEEWHFKVRPSDGTDFGHWESSPNNVTIGNTPPSASNLVITPDPNTTDDLVASCDYFDVDGDPITDFQVLWFKDDVLEPTLNNSLTVTSSLTADGENWFFSLRPSDGTDYGAWVNSTTVTIGPVVNTPPIAGNLTLSPSTPLTTDDLLASYDYFDADGDLETGSELLWFKDGILQGTLNGSTSVQAGNTSKSEEWYFKVRSSDGTDFGQWVSCPINVTIGNTAPYASNLVINPSNPNTTDDLVASCDYFDVDGDPITDLQVLWFKNVELQSSLNDFLTVTSSLTTDGESWFFSLRPSDGTDYGILVNSTTVTIGPVINTPPIIGNLTLSPSTPLTTDDLVASYDYFDADGDLETGSELLWFKDGILQGTLNGTTSIQAGNTSKSEEWHFKVRPSDGTDFGQWVSCPINVTIGNTPPYASNLVINPSNPNTTDDLVASYDYFDVDADLVTGSQVLWFKDGVLQSSLNDLLTITSSFTADGESWFFSLSPSDGTDYGTWLNSTTVTIDPVANTPPIVGNLTLSPSTPLTTDDLLASYDYFDADGDLETGSLVLWFKDGVLEPTLNNSLTVTSSLTAEGENWFFGLCPSDGTDYGAWVNSTTSTIVSVVNTPPIVGNLTLSPSTPLTTDNLVASYDYFDADGDPEVGSTIRWFRNSIEQLAYENLSIISAVETVDGDEWYFLIQVSDGTNFSQAISPSITIASIPLSVIIESPIDSTYLDSVISINLSGTAVHYWYFIDEVDVKNNSWISRIDRTLTDGVYILHAYGNDSLGNVLHDLVEFTISTNPPIILISNPVDGNGYNSSIITISLGGTADQYWYFIENYDTQNQTWVNDVSRTLNDGIYTLHAFGNDTMGRVVHVQASLFIDTIAPIITILRPVNNLNIPFQTESVKIVWEIRDQSNVTSAEIFNNGSLITSVILPSNGVEITFVEGLHNVEVVVYDVAGNKGSIAIMILVQYPETTIETANSSPGFTLLFSVLSLIVIIISFRKYNLRRRYDS